MKKSVERWRTAVQQEIDRLGVPLPVEQVLAVMWRESNGAPGAVNPSSGASGLMQVMPIALKDYNQNHKNKYTMAQLRGKTPASAAIQIRVGLWILAQFVKIAYRYIKKKVGQVALDDLVRIADTFYAAGPGAARKRLDKIETPTWEAIRARLPNWDRVRPAELVWERANEGGAAWNLPAIDQWLEGTLVIDKKKAVGGAVLGLLIIALAWFWFSKKKKRGKK